jgi:hypothetical protein
VIRYAAVCLLIAGCVSLGASAPVPKQPAKPKVLTADLVAGRWDYAWGQWPDGSVTFNADGTYTAVHDPGSNSVYFGTWKAEGDDVTIYEYRHDLATNAQTGPTTYVFTFKAADYPALKGLSNGTVAVSLSRPK